ncbi:MAG: glycosyltransferase family 39 protein [Anaerolineae bacterium]|nr:glycosyltransferase family 39 protein [Anaerolineae bacterium]
MKLAVIVSAYNVPSLKDSPFSLRAVVAAVTLLAFGLSLRQATVITVGVDELFEISQFVAQPLVNFFTNYWANGQLPHVLLTKVFGLIYWDIYTLRFGSVVAGTLSIPLMYCLAKDLYDNRIAALIAFFLSVTITHIQYSAFARGYSLMLALSLVTILCFSRALKTRRRCWWVGFAFALALNIHNHIFTVFLAAALLVFVVGWTWQERRGILSRHKNQLKDFALASGLILFLLSPMPILMLVSRNTVDSLSVLLADQQWPTSFPPLSVDHPGNLFLPLVSMAYTFSPTCYPGWQTFVFVGFFLIGILVGLKRSDFRRSTVLLVLILFLPPLLMTLTTTLLGPWFYALRRYFLFVMLPYLILAGVGFMFLVDKLTEILSSRVSTRAGFIGSGLMVFLVAPVIFPIVSYITNQDRHPFAPYAIARYIQTHAQPDDIILCVPDEDWRVSARGATCSFMLNLYPELAPQVYFWDELATYQTLLRFLSPETDCTNHYVHMPHPHFEMECLPALGQDKSRNLWLVLWRSRQNTVESARVDSPHPLMQAMFDSTAIIYLEDKECLARTLTQAGEIVLAESKTPLRKLENYISLANIYAATGNIRQTVAILDEAAFVSRWPAAIERLAELQAQLSYLQVPLEPKIRSEIVWNNDIVLVGLDQDLTTIQPVPGELIQISFYWQTLRPVTANYQVLLHLVDDQGITKGIFDYQPFDGQRPFPDWVPGQTIRETRTFVLPADLPSGTYTLAVGLYQPDIFTRLPLKDGQDEFVLTHIEVIESFEPPP